MLNTSLTPNSFNGLDPLDNRKARVSALLEIKKEAEQLAAAGADPAAVRSMVQERRKAMGREFPDEPTMKKSVNAAQKYQQISGLGFDTPPQVAPAPEAMGGFNPGFGMGTPGVNVGRPVPAPNPALERGVDDLYQRAGFKGGPVPEGYNDPGSLLSMLPHDV